MKKVVIIGGGVAGLTAGIYAQQSGFDTTIYEMHSIPGGLCTSWKRNGYLFEGGMHWLTGSKKDTILYQEWCKIGALSKDTSIFYREPFVVFEHNGQKLNIYRDLEKLESHLIEVSPEDSKAIKKLCKNIKSFHKMSMPIVDIRGVKVKNKVSMSFGQMMSFMSLLPKLSKFTNMSLVEYSKQFKSPSIRMLLENIAGEDMSSFAVIMMLATITSGDGGYPKGGSLAMALGMAKRFQSLGGKIIYNSKVDKVDVENDCVKGVIIDGELILADSVLITQDTLVAIDQLFDKPLNEPWMEKMRKNTQPLLNAFVSIGVEADLSELPESSILYLEEPLMIGNTKIKSLTINNYATYEGYAPKGCSSVTCILNGDSYNFWKKCKECGNYESEKEKLGDIIINIINDRWHKIKDKIAVLDVATPLTYERYCGSFKGSWMSNMGKGERISNYPIANKKIKNLYFAGQRMMPPGGLPAAFYTARKAVQYICKENKTVFCGKTK